MAKRKKGYRRVYDEGTGKTKLGRRKEVDVYRPLTGVGKTLVKDITYKSDDSPRVKYTEREVTRRNKDGSVKSYKNIIRKNGKIVDEATTKKIKYKDGGPKVKQRRGSRKNYDNKAWTPSGLQFPTSESSHLMMAEYDDEINPSTGKPVGWVGFPSLFQDDKPYANDQDNWVQMSGDNGWGSIYEEAKRRGEVYNFGEDKEAALAFGEGSWKDQLPDEVMEVELTDEEVEQYKAGGYVLEEMHEGGEPGHDHKDPPSYEDAMQAYKDSIAARAAYEDQHKLDLAQYEKDSVDFKRRNATYNKKLNAYNKAQDRYQRNQEYLNWLKAKYPAFPTYNEVYDASDPNKGIYYYEHMTDAGEAQRPEFARGSLDKESGDRELHLSPWYSDAISIHPGSYSEDEINRLNLDMNNMDEFTDKYLSKLSGPEMELNSYNEFIDWGLGESSGELPVITMLAPPNVKKPKPLEEQILKAVEYNPPEELKRPNFSDYVDPLPVIEPEMSQDTSLPEELQGAEEVEGVDYKIKRGPYIQPGLGGNPFGRFGKTYWRGPRLKFGERRVPIEKEQVYEEDSMPLPVFFKDGGSMDLELSPEEVSMYVKGGYVVEELPSYEPGGANDSDNPLTQWADQQQSLWEGLYEYNPKGRNLATGYFQNIGDDYNLNLIKKGKMPHWSAATISNAVMANIGASDKQTAQQLGFNPTASHSGYVRDAFKAAADPEYKYNRYVAEKPDGNYGVGDILVRGRRDGKNVGTSKWSYKNFAKTDNSYVSHGDIIVDKGEDDKGEYVVLAGGNLGDTYKNKKVYTKNLANKYKVKLKDNKKGFTMGAAPGSANKVTAAPEKFNNVGEDVTVDTKKRSLFKNNFDSDTENDQSYNQEFDSTPSMSMPSASNFSGSLVPNQQAALFGDDTLGIGYVPYQYQFPEYLGRPQEEEMLDESYMTPYENILDDNDSDVVDPDPDPADPDLADEDDNIENNVKEDLSDITEEELEQLNDEDLEKHSYNKLTFKSKPVKFDKFEKKTLSKEAKTEIQRLEDEINNLKRSPIERANEISKQIKSLEEFGDETLNERKALAKERVKLLLAIQEGAVTSDTEIDDQIKELRGQIQSIKLGESAYAVESGKITEKDYYNKHHSGFIKAMETINKKMEDGYVWASWNRNISGNELYKRGYPEVILESLDKYQTNDWRPNVKSRSNQKSNVYNSSLTGDEDIKFIEDYYGDGSNKYGQWVKSEDISQVGGFSNRTLYPEQYNEDGSLKLAYKNQNYNPTMQNSGRAAGFYPEFNALFGPLWGTIGLGDDLVSDERTVPYQEGPPDFIDQVGSDIGDALWSLKPSYFMDDLEKSRYRNMQRERSGSSYKNTFERMNEGIGDAWDWMTDWQDGGSIPKIDEGYVINLDKEEALAYARKGYIVEEIK